MHSTGTDLVFSLFQIPGGSFKWIFKYLSDDRAEISIRIQEDKPLQNMLKGEHQGLVLIFESFKEGVLFFSQQMTKVKGTAFVVPGRSLAAFHSDISVFFDRPIFLLTYFSPNAQGWVWIFLPEAFSNHFCPQGWLPPPILTALIIYTYHLEI